MELHRSHCWDKYTLDSKKCLLIICSVQMLALYRCWFYTDVGSIQTLALYRCWLYKDVFSIQILALYRYLLYTDVGYIQMFTQHILPNMQISMFLLKEKYP